MNNNLDSLKNMWQEAAKLRETEAIVSTETIIAEAQKEKQKTLKMHIGNILVLSLTLAGISAFFMYVARFNELISHIGVGLMTGGLALRILIEFFSIYRSTKIDVTETAFNTNKAWLSFHKFRKIIHGPITITILVLYTIGFYLLTPEFSLYFSKPLMILIDLSYILAAVIFTWQIRNAIKKEMNYLNELIRLDKYLIQE